MLIFLEINKNKADEFVLAGGRLSPPVIQQ